MELHIKERIYIPQMLPQQGNFLEFNLKKSIVSKVALTEKDKETYQIKEDRENGRITWNVEKDIELPLDVSFTSDEMDYLKKSCEKLSDQSFPDDFWSVVERIYNTIED